MNQQQRVDRYLGAERHKVKGYLSGLDARLIATLLRIQSTAGLGGSLCEIGVHHGRLFFLLAMLRAPGEHALAIDLFEDDRINQGTSQGDRGEGFQANAARLGVTLSADEVLKGSSLDVTPAMITNRVGATRFFSIDGGHLYKHVANDLPLANATLAETGVIAIDDFMSTAWPDVTVAACEYLLRSDCDLVPFAQTTSKLYVCRPPIADELRHSLVGHMQAWAKVGESQMLGRRVALFGDKLEQKVARRLRSVLG